MQLVPAFMRSPKWPLQRYRLAVGFRLLTIFVLIITFLWAPLLTLNLQSREVSCYGWRASLEGGVSTTGVDACISLLREINRQGQVYVSINPDVASSGELAAALFSSTVALVGFSDILSLLAISGNRLIHLIQRHWNIRESEVGVVLPVYISDISGLLRALGVLLCWIGLHTMATLRKEMADGDAFVAVDASLGSGAYVLSVFTLLSFAVPPQYGGSGE